MNISVTDPLGKATDRAKEMLFDPFELNKWLLLGFCAFLAGLGRGGFGFSFNYSMGGGGEGGAQPGEHISDATEYISEHLVIVVLIGLGIILVAFGFYALLKWLASRGDFMFLDGVIKNRGEVVEPWNETAELANSYFFFRLFLNLAMGIIGLLVVVSTAALAWGDLEAGRFGDSAVLAVVVGVAILFPLGLTFVLLQSILIDFVVPVMYKKERKVMASFKIVWNRLLKKRPGKFFLFYLMKFVLSMAAGALAMILVCCTCCMAAIPYVGSVILLPITVFFRCYSLYFLEQFGEEWELLQPLSDDVVEGEEFEGESGEEGPAGHTKTDSPKNFSESEPDRPDAGPFDEPDAGESPYDDSSSDPDEPESGPTSQGSGPEFPPNH